MPGRDRTGPFGTGPVNYFDNNYRGMGIGRGTRNGFGSGLGRRNRAYWSGYNYVSSPENQKQLLNEEKEYLESRLNFIKKELGE